MSILNEYFEYELFDPNIILSDVENCSNYSKDKGEHALVAVILTWCGAIDN